MTPRQLRLIAFGGYCIGVGGICLAAYALEEVKSVYHVLDKVHTELTFMEIVQNYE